MESVIIVSILMLGMLTGIAVGACFSLVLSRRSPV